MSQNYIVRPKITEYIEREHTRLSEKVSHLLMRLDDAKRQRDICRSKLMERDYIDHNAACAYEWLKFAPVSGHSWKNHRNICATLKRLLHDMNTCNCCTRHTINRPTYDDIDRRIHYSPKSSVSRELHRSNLECCDCMCRNVARKIQIRLYNLAMETDSETESEN